MAVTGWKVPSAAPVLSPNPTSGTVTNVQANDSSYLYWGLGNKATCDIEFTGFGFTTTDIPTGATIDGIEVQLQGYGAPREDVIQLSLSSIVQGTNKATGLENWPNSDDNTYRTWGGADDQWGWTTITDTDVRSSGFGITFQFYATGATDVYIDHVQVRVYYTASSITTLTHNTITCASSIGNPTVAFLRHLFNTNLTVASIVNSLTASIVGTGPTNPSRRTGTNESITYYDSAGGYDYTDMNTWVGDTNVDMSAATGNSTSYVLECYAGNHNDTVVIDGGTPDANHFRIVRPVVGEGHNGIPKTDGSIVYIYYDGGAATLQSVFLVDESYVQIQDLYVQVTGTASTANRALNLRNGIEVKAIACLCQGNSSGYGYPIQMGGSAGNYYAVNCVVFDAARGFFVQGTDSVHYVYNGTADNCSANSLTVASGTSYYTNCILPDGVSGGTGTTSVTTAPDYVDSANDDFHLAETATTAIGQGTDLSNDANFAFDDDIDGELRTTASWDIGADQYVAEALETLNGTDLASASSITNAVMLAIRTLKHTNITSATQITNAALSASRKFGLTDLSSITQVVSLTMNVVRKLDSTTISTATSVTGIPTTLLRKLNNTSLNVSSSVLDASISVLRTMSVTNVTSASDITNIVMSRTGAMEMTNLSSVAEVTTTALLVLRAVYTDNITVSSEITNTILYFLHSLNPANTVVSAKVEQVVVPIVHKLFSENITSPSEVSHLIAQAIRAFAITDVNTQTQITNAVVSIADFLREINTASVTTASSITNAVVDAVRAIGLSDVVSATQIENAILGLTGRVSFVSPNVVAQITAAVLQVIRTQVTIDVSTVTEVTLAAMSLTRQIAVQNVTLPSEVGDLVVQMIRRFPYPAFIDVSSESIVSALTINQIRKISIDNITTIVQTTLVVLDVLRQCAIDDVTVTSALSEMIITKTAQMFGDSISVTTLVTDAGVIVINVEGSLSMSFTVRSPSSSFAAKKPNGVGTV